MDASKLLDVCRKYSAKEYFVEPVPDRKAGNARKSLHVPTAERIIALIDFTVFGSADDALVITDDGIRWKHFGEDDVHRLTWPQFRQRSIAEKKTLISKKILLGNGLEVDLNGAASLVERDNHLVVDLLNELKDLESSAVYAPALGSRDTVNTVGLTECEFCKGKNKPYATYCKHCGIKLRG